MSAKHPLTREQAFRVAFSKVASSVIFHRLYHWLTQRNAVRNPQCLYCSLLSQAVKGLKVALLIAALLLVPTAARSQEAVCVPPGLPPFSEWISSGGSPIVALDELNRPVLLAFMAYEARGKRLNGLWLGPILVSVDPDPDDMAVRAWHDRGATTPTTALRVAPRQACDWFRLPPREEQQT